jgi:bifunctional non-homologous end joining protein LigD
MPDETVIDGEVVALESGRPSFDALQNYDPSKTNLVYYAFDVMIMAGRDVMGEPLTARREVLQKILAKLDEPIRHSPNWKRAFQT